MKLNQIDGNNKVMQSILKMHFQAIEEKMLLASESSLKMMKNALICLNFLIIQRNGLIRKIWSFSKFMVS